MTRLPPELEERVYEAWLDGDEAERERAFESLRAAHPEHAEALLLLHERLATGDDVLGKIVTGVGHGAPDRIGEYEILEEVGAGGFGVVYRATQCEPIERTVAIKVLLAERLHGTSLIRFENERQALALMDHSAIAHVFDAGTTDEGQPYFVMEFVEGVSITEFCDEKKLGIPARLDLFRRVCAAVQHAHQKGVVHRDLKPSNVLVFEQDGRPMPKIIDFGIAKALVGAAVRQDFTTLEGGLVGTPEYMSPEQAASGPIDTRTDVYALGVLLYELLIGDLPFGRERLKAEGLVEVARIVREEEPRRPSSSSGTWTSAAVSVIAANRDTTPQKLVRTLGGDLDWVVLEALQKEPAARYESAAALAEDVGRFQRHLPVEARQPAFVYVARKFARRHRVGVAVAASVISMLALGITGLIWAVFEVEQARQVVDDKLASVKRLAALEDHEDLITKAGELWPAVPENIDAYREWIEDADRLVANQHLHVAKRKELSSLALPPSDEEREAERASHPDLPRLGALGAEIASKRAAFLQRHDGVPGPELPELDWSPHGGVEADLAAWLEAAQREGHWYEFPSYAAKLNVRAFDLVDPEREIFGREAEGLALARRALELARAERDDEVVAEASHTLSRAFFALGQDAEALEESGKALEIASEEDRERFERHRADLVRWVEKASGDEGRRAAEEELARLEAERTEVETRVGERQDWLFPDTEDGHDARWWHANLTKLIQALEELQVPETGLSSEAEGAVSPVYGWSVPRRLALAERLRVGFAPGGEFDADWHDAIQSIREHPDYGGLLLTRQAGLVPIGPDPDSGLWEFWHVASGDEPLRGEGGVLSMTEESGLVLVLLPGGTFKMGAQGDPKRPNHDPLAHANEVPVHDVTLEPYFLSKYEMTQGQWKRLAGRNPSAFGPDGIWSTSWSADGQESSLLYAVEQVSWHDCMRELDRAGLSLPREAQWEYGARAGTESRWWIGDGKQRLKDAANLADGYAQEHGGGPAAEGWLDDGYSLHAPVNTLRANGFGLHHVHGNVEEWTLGTGDRYHSRSHSDPAERDTRADRAVRSGSFFTSAAVARSATRLLLQPSHSSYSVGVRPAAGIEP